VTFDVAHEPVSAGRRTQPTPLDRVRGPSDLAGLTHQELTDLAAEIRTALQAACGEQAVTASVRTLGLPPRFIAHADREDLLEAAGLDGPGITRIILGALATSTTTGAGSLA
jgi:deoxyxylulose-5-phosphate synthase